MPGLKLKNLKVVILKSHVLLGTGKSGYILYLSPMNIFGVTNASHYIVQRLIIWLLCRTEFSLSAITKQYISENLYPIYESNSVMCVCVCVCVTVCQTLWALEREE